MARLATFLTFICVVLALLSTQTYAKPNAKTDRLVKLTKSGKGIVKLDSNSFIKSLETPRDYAMVVVLTAMGDKFRCAPCKEFDPEYRLVASSYHNKNTKEDLFFGYLDFEDGQAVFQQMNINSAPTILYYPANSKNKPTEPKRYDASKHGFSAEPFAQFLSREIGHEVPVHRPFDYTKNGIKLFLVVGALAASKLLFSHFSFMLYNKYTWSLISLVTILTMISGHMWNHIRKPPYVIPGKNGQINYIANGFQAQLGMESQVVAVIYGVLAFSTVSLAISVPRLDKGKQRIAVWIWMGCLLVLFSFLMSLFRIKNGGYPFKLLF
ncbi:oligosaccharyl transferase subunit ost3/OST6 [Umbelopsis sp. WA50703]